MSWMHNMNMAMEQMFRQKLVKCEILFTFERRGSHQSIYHESQIQRETMQTSKPIEMNPSSFLSPLDFNFQPPQKSNGEASGAF
jgi:hypothetical protein